MGHQRGWPFPFRVWRSISPSCPCFHIPSRRTSLRRASPPPAPQRPSGAAWLHEIKHDGFRVIARKNCKRVKLYSRPGNDLTKRFPLIVETVARLRPQSCTIDGEAVACGPDGIACFKLIRRWYLVETRGIPNV